MNTHNALCETQFTAVSKGRAEQWFSQQQINNYDKIIIVSINAEFKVKSWHFVVAHRFDGTFIVFIQLTWSNAVNPNKVVSEIFTYLPEIYISAPLYQCSTKWSMLELNILEKLKNIAKMNSLVIF